MKPFLGTTVSHQRLLPISTLTREQVRVRARALASDDGRSPVDVSQIDYEQAKRELTGKSGLAQQEAMLDLLPESIVAKTVRNITFRQMPDSSLGATPEGDYREY